jgi:hypothetical protein
MCARWDVHIPRAITLGLRMRHVDVLTKSVHGVYLGLERHFRERRATMNHKVERRQAFLSSLDNAGLYAIITLI